MGLSRAKPIVPRSGSSASRALVSKFPNAINGQVIDLLAERGAAAHIVVPRTFLPLIIFKKMNSDPTIMGHLIPVRDDSTPYLLLT
jgi:hypothetical protein